MRSSKPLKLPYDRLHKVTASKKDIILTCVLWYLAYPLSYRNPEERMAEFSLHILWPEINILERFCYKFLFFKSNLAS